MRRFRVVSAGLAALVLAATSASASSGRQAVATHEEPAVGRQLADEPGTIVAAFTARSYSPGERAVLRVMARSAPFLVQVLRIGSATGRSSSEDPLSGTPVSGLRRVVPTRRGEQRVVVPMASWASGMYFARLTDSSGELGYAPFVLRARRPGSSRVLIVLPTNTWQAYNYRDVDGNGVGDTWYASPDVHVVDLARPYLNRGVPPQSRKYDRGFVRWLAATGKHPDFFADDDLDRVPNGDVLAKAYRLVIFPGHEEYVTPHAFDVIERFRDLGGNLAFLSANTFVYRVERHGNQMIGRTAWQQLGRPPARLTGSDYVDWWQRRYPSRPYVVVGARWARWLFAGTGLHEGSTFGSFGIEVDSTSANSPRGTHVLARIKDIFGPGSSAEMTYYETHRGAEVFAAGAMNFGAGAQRRPVSVLLENLWRHLSAP
jgi:hypothetical protein